MEDQKFCCEDFREAFEGREMTADGHGGWDVKGADIFEVLLEGLRYCPWCGEDLPPSIGITG